MDTATEFPINALRNKGIVPIKRHSRILTGCPSSLLYHTGTIRQKNMPLFHFHTNRGVNDVSTPHRDGDRMTSLEHLAYSTHTHSASQSTPAASETRPYVASSASNGPTMLVFQVKIASFTSRRRSITTTTPSRTSSSLSSSATTLQTDTEDMHNSDDSDDQGSQTTESEHDDDNSIPHLHPPMMTTTTITLCQIDDTLLDSIQSLWQSTIDFLSAFMEVISQTSFKAETVEKVSIGLLGLGLVFQQCLVPFLAQQQQYFDKESSSPLGGDSQSWMWPLTPHLLWILPIMTSIISMSLSLTLLLQFRPAETAVLAGVVVLLVMECLLPLAFATCVAMCVIQVMSLECTAIVLITIWLTCAISSRCIRVALYPSLGHG